MLISMDTGLVLTTISTRNTLFVHYVCLIFTFPMVYMIFLVAVTVVKKTHLVQKLLCVYQKASAGRRCTSAAGREESLPYRLFNSDWTLSLQSNSMEHIEQKSS